jgi:hypothetical protein
MAAPTYKFSEFVDLLLVKLYELDREQGQSGFFDLNRLATDIKGDVPREWVFDAAKVLETRALADCIFTFGGTHAKISGEGRLYVEEGRGITKKVQEAPSTYYVNINGSNNQVVAGHNATEIRQTAVTNDQTPVAALLKEIDERIQSDAGLPKESREEALVLTDVVRREIKKIEPNRTLLGAVLDPLSKISSIAGNVATLIKLFNASV